MTGCRARRAQSYQSSGRRSPAPRHRHRAAPRSADRMEPAVCGARTQSGITAAAAHDPELRVQNAVELRAQARPPGTEFLDAETGRQNRPLKCANVGRDQSPGIEWPKIPAETTYLASYRKRVVCMDWMVVCAVICEPVSASQALLFPVICIFQGQGSLAFFLLASCTLYVSPHSL